ncbi:peptidoglycan/xylan/chitin deacetylase (PgdA/CDA1 family) [Leucobacter exalbidus]|uniref:Peptidoglycan/xylan/chitin deacetylase (PgdA/CDA1 family) n=1 Tax=Leucobacter exalbidus TaxID=662960 RepID=A0A940T686_9MICO|nr:polysaccharide deacetylase family protein [Leucobacter exalbidus]MBP1326746.1 peptidoglycan/xylan/chitin deacetylase (PgdA/CDA1 family) [Leucobacter exalbidus]
MSAAVTVTAMGLLLGCAQLPADTNWSPPDWPAPATMVTVVTAAGEPAEASETVEPAKPAAKADAAEATSAAPLVPADADLAGFIDGRIRNDRAGVQIRYVEIVGADSFNASVATIIDDAIASTGISSFTPEVFDTGAGLAERGCVAGSLAIPAAELLKDPAYGPVDGDGTAVVCEVTAAFGPVVGVSFRMVAGLDGDITRDTTTALFANLETGGVTAGAELWTAEAAGELWQGTVDGLRRDAWALSAAPTQPPSDEQLALAQAALAGAGFTGAGARLTLPAGITSAELTALGAGATTVPLTVEVDSLDGWLTPAGDAILALRGTPFVGVPAWNGAHPVSCAIDACVAVTYDDGPSGFTAELLDTFAAHESAATFFMLGNAVLGNPEVVARAAGAGHELASHTMSHPDLTTISPKKARRQVHQAGTAITDAAGVPVTMYRPPYGAVDAAVISAVGWPAILWSIDTLDWQQPGQKALVKRSAQAATPGDIILFHDTHADTVNAADAVVEGLRNRGFTLVTVTQLFDGEVPGGRVSSR